MKKMYEITLLTMTENEITELCLCIGVGVVFHIPLQ